MKRIITSLMLLLLWGCTGYQESTEETYLVEYNSNLQIYNDLLENGTRSLESGNFDEALNYYSQARTALSDSTSSLNSYCNFIEENPHLYTEEEIRYSGRFCEGTLKELNECEPELLSFMEASVRFEQNKTLSSCNAMVPQLRNTNDKCSVVYENYGDILGKWESLGDAEELESACNKLYAIPVIEENNVILKPLGCENMEDDRDEYLDAAGKRFALLDMDSNRTSHEWYAIMCEAGANKTCLNSTRFNMYEGEERVLPEGGYLYMWAIAVDYTFCAKWINISYFPPRNDE